MRSPLYTRYRFWDYVTDDFFIGLFVGMYIIGRFKELTTWIISYSDEMYGMRILLEREEVSYAFSLN